MIIAFWLVVLYVIPIWFLCRLKYFANHRESKYSWSDNFENVDLGFAIFFVMVVSWIGFFIGAMLSGSTKSDMARTFFLPERSNSIHSRMFWDKVRRFGLALLFIKESK